MKNKILLMLCLAVSVFVNAQILQTPFTPTAGSEFAGQCNCYSFTAPTYNPFIATEPLSDSDPGHSYFWVWGDGQDDYEVVPKVPIVHCFNGNAQLYQAELHLTPRKTPLPSNLNAVTFTVTTTQSCSAIPPSVQPSGISFNHPIKIGEKFVLIVDAETCNNQPSNFTLSFQTAGQQNWFNEVNRPNAFTPIANGYTFSLPNGSKRFYLELECNSDASLHLNEITFSLERNGTPNRNGKVDPTCYKLIDTKRTITGGPYDPNVLYTSHGSNMDECLNAGDTIRYRVRFQNISNGPTSSVKLVFDLDSRLDINTFKVERIESALHSDWRIFNSSQTLPTSRPYALILAQPAVNLPTIAGNAIQLSCLGMELNGLLNSPEFETTGWVTFSAVLNTNMAPGEEISTSAHVYFCDSVTIKGTVMEDDLAPVETNTIITSCKKVERTFWDSFLCWVSCWHKWIIGILLLLFLWCFWSKRRKHFIK